MKVLIIDDEPQIRRAVKVGLERNGCAVTVASNGDEGLDAAAEKTFDVVILDLAMPGMDGYEVCRQLREWSKVPVIVLSVRSSPQEKVKALDIGADDYLTKPFSLDELLARIRALLRRVQGEEEGPPSLTIDELHLDFARRRVTLDGREVRLTPTEYELLKYLALNADRVVTQQQLLTTIWGDDAVGDPHTLRVHVANLRNKIEPDPARPRFLHTEPRVGYRFKSER